MATIAGLGLQYSSSFPHLSQLHVKSPTGSDWNDIYKSTIELLRHRAVRALLERSYSGVYVDEYQDCNLAQHNIVLAIAEALPCRLLGDPLQGIFEFAGNPVNWRDNVAPSFERLPDLSTPHRWLAFNPDLGAWLSEVRPRLAEGLPIDLSDYPGQWFPQTPANQLTACRRAAGTTDGSVVAITRFRPGSYQLASKLGGLFGSMEELDCERLMNFAKSLDRTTDGHDWVVSLIDLASACFTGIGSRLAKCRSQYEAGTAPSTARLTTNHNIVESLNLVAEEPSATTLVGAARRIEQAAGGRPYRRELWHEVKTTLLSHPKQEQQNFIDTAWRVRERARRFGRLPDRRLASTTLLVKGLEFDQCVVIDADKLSAKELYVAMTRGRTGLTVLSSETTIQKKPVENVLD